MSAPTRTGPQGRRDPAALQLLAAIVESSSDAIVSKDLNSIVTSWNKSAEAMFGYTAEEIIGKPIALIMPPELRDEEPLILARIKAGNRIEHFETERLHKNGERIPISLTVSPIQDERGTIVGAAQIARNLTRQKNAELAASRLAAIVESSDDAIISKDLGGIVTSWNQAAERILGYTAEEMIGKPITLIIPRELHDDEPKILGKIASGQRIEHFQTVRCRKNGEPIDVSLTISPVRDQNGRIVGAAKILRDITQQKRMEAALHMSERLASVGRMAATVAHEINNPLEAITNFIYLAKHQPGLTEKSRSYLTSADQELTRVAHIAQQTLGFYRDNSEATSFAASAVVADVLAIYERKLKFKNLKVEKQIDGGLAVSAIKGELKQILSNLIANAIDASHENDVILIRARASVDPRSHREGVRFTVADHGSGISSEDKKKVFIPFFTTKKNIGTGLGLWITKDLLEKRGGRIHFRSSKVPPTGTVMSIFLPSELPTHTTEFVA